MVELELRVTQLLWRVDKKGIDRYNRPNLALHPNKSGVKSVEHMNKNSIYCASVAKLRQSSTSSSADMSFKTANFPLLITHAIALATADPNMPLLSVMLLEMSDANDQLL